MKLKRTIAYILAVVALALIAVGGYKLLKSRQMYKTGDEAYELLRSKALADPEAQTVPAEETKPESLLWVRQADIPNRAPDFDELHKVNTDIIGWLYCPDTMVDYPVVGADDYEYYTVRLPDGTWNGNGTLFLDYHVAWDFSDRFNIIYGHCMTSGAMFGRLSSYKNQEYYEEHPYWYLYTPDGNYRVDLMYGFIIAEKDWRGEELTEIQQQDEMLAFAAENTTFQSAVQPDDDSRYVAFSTCTYEFSNARYVVLGLLTPEFATQPQNA